MSAARAARRAASRDAARAHTRRVTFAGASYPVVVATVDELSGKLLRPATRADRRSRRDRKARLMPTAKRRMDAAIATMVAAQAARVADPARLARDRARVALADSRYARRLGRRADSLGTEPLRPAGFGAKHYQHDRALRADAELLARARDAAAAAGLTGPVADALAKGHSLAGVTGEV